MALAKPKILIVDDEQAVCDLLSDQLHEQGYLCSIALDGTEALAKLAAEDFDVVLLDILLPDISGIEVLTKIQLKHPHVTTVVVTAVDSIDTAIEATKLGAADYIVKPFRLSRLDASISTILKSKTSSLKKREREQVAKKSHRLMDAIAFGVEARLDRSFGYSKTVIKNTINIARLLGINEREIKRWAAIRSKQSARRAAAIESSVDKFMRNPLAQNILDMAVPYIYRPKQGGYHN